MSFNTSKCKLLRITTKRNPITHSYRMADDLLETVKHHPYLGVELPHNLKWTNHIDNITAKANQALWFIRCNLQRCPTSVKQQMYFALVRPILDYASVVWDPHTTSDIQRLEMIQRRAARFVTNNYKRTEGTATDILSKLEWPSLQQHRRVTTCRYVQNSPPGHSCTNPGIYPVTDSLTYSPTSSCKNFVSCSHLPMCTNSVSFHAPS